MKWHSKCPEISHNIFIHYLQSHHISKTYLKSLIVEEKYNFVINVVSVDSPALLQTMTLTIYSIPVSQYKDVVLPV